MRCKIKFPHREKLVERERFGQFYIRHNTDEIPVVRTNGEWEIAPEWAWVYEKEGGVEGVLYKKAIQEALDGKRVAYKYWDKGTYVYWDDYNDCFMIVRDGAETYWNMDRELTVDGWYVLSSPAYFEDALQAWKEGHEIKSCLGISYNRSEDENPTFQMAEINGFWTVD